MSKTGLSDLRMHLFDTLERVKSISDPDCSDKDKCSLEQAQTICKVSDQIIESFKVEVNAMQVLVKAANEPLAEDMAKKSSLFLQQ